MTIRERVWHLLNERGPMSTREVAEALGLEVQQATMACTKLIERGYVVKTGGGHQTRYAAVGKFVGDPRREVQERSEPPPIPCALADVWGWMPRENIAHKGSA